MEFLQQPGSEKSRKDVKKKAILAHPFGKKLVVFASHCQPTVSTSMIALSVTLCSDFVQSNNLLM